METTTTALNKNHENLTLSTVSVLRVIKRHQTSDSPAVAVAYDENKITNAMKKAYLAVEGSQAENSPRIKIILNQLTQQITDILLYRHKESLVHVEEIQDQVELALMRAGEHRIARAYVLYREERRRLREQRTHLQNEMSQTPSKQDPYSQDQMSLLAEDACQTLESVDPQLITKEAQRNLFQGASLTDLKKALQLSAKAMIEKEFNYLGLQTLYDRYFLHHHGTHFELPQAFFMRVAMGLAMNEEDKENRAVEFYLLLSSFDYISSTPTLFNSGTLRPQLSSCFLSTVPDD